MMVVSTPGLDPDPQAVRQPLGLLIARADLSELYVRMGRPADALAVVKALEAMPRRTPVDAWFQGYARGHLPR